MRLARGLLIFTYGLFTVAAQTLLFREFITTFEGSDISVGVYFGSWFLWIGLGAVLVRRWGCLADALLRRIDLLFLVYVPAFVVQLLLIVQVRELAGVASYDLMSVQTLVSWALIANAPISFLSRASTSSRRPGAAPAGSPSQRSSPVMSVRFGWLLSSLPCCVRRSSLFI
jgi:hypothetical protein